MQDPRALAVAGPAAQAAVGRAPGAVVAGDEIGVGARLVAVHARVGLVDRVPAEPLMDATDRLQAPAPVELDGAVHVDRRDRDQPPAPRSSARRAARPPPPAARRRAIGRAASRTIGGQLDVAVELADVVEIAPAGRREAQIERAHLAPERDCRRPGRRPERPPRRSRSRARAPSASRPPGCRRWSHRRRSPNDRGAAIERQPPAPCARDASPRCVPGSRAVAGHPARASRESNVSAPLRLAPPGPKKVRPRSCVALPGRLTTHCGPRARMPITNPDSRRRGRVRGAIALERSDRVHRRGQQRLHITLLPPKLESRRCRPEPRRPHAIVDSPAARGQDRDR